MGKWIALVVFISGVFLISTKIQLRSDIEDPSLRESFSGDQKLLSVPTDVQFSVPVSLEKPSEILLPFKKPVSVSGLSIFFPGNLHSISSYLAREFRIYYKLSDGKWVLFDEVLDNRKSDYKHTIGKDLLVSAFKINISRAAFDDSIQISDLKFYKTKSISLFDFIVVSIHSYDKSYISYLILSLVLFIFVLFPGYAFLTIIDERWGMVSPREYKFIFAPVFSILVLGGVTMLYLFSSSFYWFYLYLFLFIYSTAFLFRRKLFRQIFSEAKWPLALIALVLIVVNSLQAKRDFLFNLNYIESYIDKLEFVPDLGGYFGYHFDNTLQWGISREFLHRTAIFSEASDKYRLGGDGNNFLDRTPLLPLITTPILFFFGESHFVYQRYLNLLMSLYYSASFILLTKFFSRWTSKVTSLLLLLSGPITYQVFNTEVYFKYFAIYPILLAIIIWRNDSKIVIKLKIPLIGLFMAMAYFIHPMTILFSGLLLVGFILRSKFSWNSIKKLLITVVPLFLIVVIWTGFIKYEKSIALSRVAPRTGIYETNFMSFKVESLQNIFYNSINFFLPDFLDKSKTFTSFISKNYFLQQLLRLSLIAAITPVLFIWLLFSLFDSSVWKRYSYQLLFGIGPIILYLIFLRQYSLGLHAVFYPFMLPFLLGISVNLLENKGRLFRLTILISFPIFSLLYIHYLSGTYSTLKYLSPFTRLLTYPIIGVYFLSSVFLAKLCSRK